MPPTSVRIGMGHYKIMGCVYLSVCLLRAST